MIYTVTFNPAIDYIAKTDNLCFGETNRSACEEIFFGGKGINVSCVLKELGVDSVALGFIAGFTGKALETHLKEKGIKTDFITLPYGFTRINVKLKGKQITEINGSGPKIDNESLNLLFEKLDKVMKKPHGNYKYPFVDPGSGPVPMGRGGDGVFEYTINLTITYMKE